MGFNVIIISQSFKDLPGCHNQCFPQIFASNWQLSHLVSGWRQVTSQCASGELSEVHSKDGQTTPKQYPPRNLRQGIIKSEIPFPRYTSGQRGIQSKFYCSIYTYSSYYCWCLLVSVLEFWQGNISAPALLFRETTFSPIITALVALQ